MSPKPQQQLLNSIGVLPIGKMIVRLNRLGMSNQDIARFTSLDLSMIQSMTNEQFVASDPANSNHRRIYSVYLKVKIKSNLKASPFMGSVKGADRLGISIDDYEDHYSELLELGEIEVVEETPEWSLKTLKKQIVK